jgi:hypothetical protein
MSLFVVSFTLPKDGVGGGSDVGSDSRCVGFLGLWVAESVELLGLIGAGLRSIFCLRWARL